MKHAPLRSCIVCRAQKAKSELVRIVRSSDGAIALDVTGKADGRGAYVCRCAACAEGLVKKRALNRAFKAQIAQETYAEIAEELKKLDNDGK